MAFGGNRNQGSLTTVVSKLPGHPDAGKCLFLVLVFL